MRCPRCGLVFGADKFIKVSSPNSETVTATGNKVTCPRCGALAEQAVHGTFEVSPEGHWHHLASALRPRDATPEDYQELLRALQAAKDTGASASQAASDINENSPVFAGLAEFIRKHGENWILIICAVLTVWYARKAIESHQPPATPLQVTVNVRQPSEQQIEQWIKNAVRQQELIDRGVSPARNLPCVCGSGAKFKKCCGAPGGPLHR